MAEDNAQDTVHDWIHRAKRAHDLVDRVDLDKVVAHDSDEVNKLDKLTDALKDLSEGQDVEYVPGVDEEDAPTLDPDQIRRLELMEMLDREGLSDWLGRVYMMTTVDDGGSRALDLIPHRDGLPEFDVCLAPEFTPAEGAHGIFVSEKGVFSALIPEPVTRHKWRILRSRPFDDHNEMITTIRRFMTKSE